MNCQHPSIEKDLSDERIPEAELPLETGKGKKSEVRIEEDQWRQHDERGIKRVLKKEMKWKAELTHLQHVRYWHFLVTAKRFNGRRSGDGACCTWLGATPANDVLRVVLNQRRYEGAQRRWRTHRRVSAQHVRGSRDKMSICGELEYKQVGSVWGYWKLDFCFFFKIWKQCGEKNKRIATSGRKWRNRRVKIKFGRRWVQETRKARKQWMWTEERKKKVRD